MQSLSHSANRGRFEYLRKLRQAGSVVTIALGLSAASAIASAGAPTQELVTQSEIAVQEARRSIGQAETGAIELQRATEHLEAAKSALARGQEKEADHRAEQAQLHAELAVAKVQSAEARRAAAEVAASTETLRKEIERTATEPTFAEPKAKL